MHSVSHLSSRKQLYLTPPSTKTTSSVAVDNIDVDINDDDDNDDNNGHNRDDD